MTRNDVVSLCEKAGLVVSDEFVEACHPVIAALDGCAQLTMARDGQMPTFDSGYDR